MERPDRQRQGDGGPQNLGVDADLGRKHRTGRLTVDAPVAPDSNLGVDDLQLAVLEHVAGLRHLNDATNPPHAMFAVGVQLHGATDRVRCHSAGRTLLRPDVVRRRRNRRVVSDPILAPDLGADYIWLARFCDAVSSTTGSSWFGRLGASRHPFFGPTTRRCSPPCLDGLPSHTPPAEFSDRDVPRLQIEPKPSHSMHGNRYVSIRLRAS